MRRYMRRKYLRRAGRILPKVLARGIYEFTFDLMPMRASAMPLRKRLNLIRSGLNLFYRPARPWSWPIHMQIELTNYCNLRCRVCPTGTGLMRREKGNLDVDLYARLMKEAGPYLLTASLWGWGEPLLHPHFEQIVRITRDQGVIPLISTNGQNLQNERVLEGLLDEPPTYLIVAIDGLTRETHSAYRVGADLDQILEGVHRLAELKRARNQELPLLNMRFIPMKHNEHEMASIERFASKNQFDYLTIRTLNVMDALGAPHGELIPEDDAFRAYRYRGSKRIHQKDFLCQMAFAFPAVRVDGSVVACDQDYNGEQEYGRFGNGLSFSDIWWGGKASEVRKTIRDRREVYGACRACPYADHSANECTIAIYDLARGKDGRPAPRSRGTDPIGG